ncbi:hypothetical protein FLJC2902T_30840 [Flavobacterium limnosediminis JC2902]|uniref:Uncharacterized protein n=1 Tax=Flavobacterium limnosediminis JC2902 TaxID=1341181 RepID=V6SGM9_9FLAO|nr:hypothetical protein FLJC2902T_30840 [Flavobacterium limnosediminis JC2902]
MKKFSFRFNLNFLKNFPCFAGCKGNTFFLISQVFFNYFSI